MLSTSCDRLRPDDTYDESYLHHPESTPAMVLSPKHPLALASHRAGGKPSPVMLDDYPTSVEGGNSPRSHAVMHNNALRQEKQRRRKLSRLYTE